DRQQRSSSSTRGDFLSGNTRLPERKPFASENRTELPERRSDSDYSFNGNARGGNRPAPRRYGTDRADRSSTGSSYGNRSESTSSGYNRSSDNRSSGGYSRGGSSYGGNRSGGYGNRSTSGGYGNRRSGGGNRNRGMAQHINESKYI